MQKSTSKTVTEDHVDYWEWQYVSICTEIVINNKFLPKFSISDNKQLKVSWVSIVIFSSYFLFYTPLMSVPGVCPFGICVTSWMIFKYPVPILHRVI